MKGDILSVGRNKHFAYVEVEGSVGPVVINMIAVKDNDDFLSKVNNIASAQNVKADKLKNKFDDALTLVVKKVKPEELVVNA